MNILVTGSNGQLGMSLRSIAGDYPDRFFFTDVIGEGPSLDITDPVAIKEFIKRESIDLVINCAAYTNVDKAEDDTKTAALLNSTAPGYLARACHEGSAALIHISTDYVFSGEASRPLRPGDATAPRSVYGATKLAGEREIAQSGCRHCIIRTAWLYSEFGKNFVKTMLGLFATKDVVRVVSDQVGTPTYARDLARAIMVVAHLGFTQNRILHYSNEGEISWFEFAREIARASGHGADKVAPCASSEFPSKVNRPHYSVLDKTDIKALGVVVPDWKESLSICLQNMKNEG